MLMVLLTSLTTFDRRDYTSVLTHPMTYAGLTRPTNNPPGRSHRIDQLLFLSLAEGSGRLDGKVEIMETLGTIRFSNIFRSPGNGSDENWVGALERFSACFLDTWARRLGILETYRIVSEFPLGPESCRALR